MNKKTLQSLLAGAAVAVTCSTQAQTLTTGPSTTTSPYLDITSGSTITTLTSILTAGDSIGGYKMGGIPDGLGAYDNGNGTFTVLMNHEWNPTYSFSGTKTTASHAQGGNGAYISEWVINKNDFSVASGQDLIQKVNYFESGAWNSYAATGISSNIPVNDPKISFWRFCSADLASPSAFYNSVTGFGTTNRLFLTGEETSSSLYTNSLGVGQCRGIAAVASGADKGAAYVLPSFTRATTDVGWENLLANPHTGDKTVVIGTSDGGKNGVWLYSGTKTNAGNDVEKAGLVGGDLYRIAVNNTNNSGSFTNSESRSAVGYGLGLTAGSGLVKAQGNFSLLNATNPGTATTFLRPEDGAWSDANNFYFVTTDQALSSTPAGRSRLWQMSFSDINNPLSGGTLNLLLDGTEGQNMFDNMTVDKDGNIILQEDIGNNAALGKIWKYNVSTGGLETIAQFKSAPFTLGQPAFITQDEESSGVIDITDVLNKGDGSRYYLFDAQVHQTVADASLVEGGQLLVAQAVPEPSTYALIGLGVVAMLMAVRRGKNA